MRWRWLIYDWWHHLSRINIWLFVESTPVANEEKQQIIFRERHGWPTSNTPPTPSLIANSESEKKFQLGPDFLRILPA